MGIEAFGYQFSRRVPGRQCAFADTDKHSDSEEHERKTKQHDSTTKDGDGIEIYQHSFFYRQGNDNQNGYRQNKWK